MSITSFAARAEKNRKNAIRKRKEYKRLRKAGYSDHETCLFLLY